MDDNRTLPFFFRKKRNLRLPITLSVALMSLNVALMVFWIVLLARHNWWGSLTIGTVAFALILVGLSFYLALTIKEIRLNRRQSNFVDSVTHELKSPIASLKLYLQTLQMRSVDEKQREKFLGVMEKELQRLDNLISQLLEVGRLDAIGLDTDPVDVKLTELLQECAAKACTSQGCEPETTFRFETQQAIVHARRIVLEMIFTNLFENAVKYGGNPPEVIAQVTARPRGRIAIRVIDNGEGIPPEMRKKIFRIFIRGGHELERKRKGTGLGLYIVKTLVHSLKGRISVNDRNDQTGSVFEVELPGKSNNG